MSFIVRCPSCKANNELEEEDLEKSLLECPSCGNKSLIEDFSVLMFCPHCRQKLAIPADMINEEEIYCVACDMPFKPKTSISLNDDLEEDDSTTLYANEEQVSKQLFHPGDFFDKYEIISLLGKGGMGEVYLANHLLLNKNVAIKIMLASCAAKSPIVAKRFIREAKLANKIQSPNIIAVYDVGIEQTNSHLFIAMEYVNGRNLSEIMHLRGTFTESETLSIALEVCNALLLMETNHIVHRDIKPSNIMINDKKVVKLADLGIAKADSTSAAGELTLTADSLVFGTPNYASPEQCRSSHHTDTRSDIYSLGATMFHMVTGKAPFSGITPMDIMYKVLNEDPLDINTLASNLSTPFKQLIIDMMQKNPALRPQCITDLIDRIKDIISGVSTSTQTTQAINHAIPETEHKTSLSAFLKRIIPSTTKLDTKEKTSFNFLSKSLTLLSKALVIILVAFGGLFILSLFTDIKIIPAKTKVEPAPKTTSQPGITIPQKPSVTPQEVPKPTKETPKQTQEEKKDLQPKQVATTSQKTSPQLPKTKIVSQTAKETQVVIPKKLNEKEFLAVYEEIFFKDESLNSPETFLTLKSRLDRTNKILSSPKLRFYRTSDNRFKLIYNYQKKVKHRLETQIKNHEIRNEKIAKAQYSSFETNQAKTLITNYLIALLKNKNAKDKNIEKIIIKALTNPKVNPNISITFSPDVFYLLPENNQNIYQTRTEVTTSLCSILTNINFLHQIDISFMVEPFFSNPLIQVPQDMNIINSYFLELGVDNLKNNLLIFASNAVSYYEENILEVGDNFNQYDKDGNSILHYIARTKSHDILLAALCSGVRINDTNDDEETALFWATRYNDRKISETLIKFGADTNVKNKDGKLAKAYSVSGSFNTAIRKNDDDLAQHILPACLNKEPKLKDALLYNFQTPVFYAIQSRKLYLLKILLSMGANVNVPDHFLRFTPLDYLLLTKLDSGDSLFDDIELEMISLLLKHGNNVFTSLKPDTKQPFIIQYHTDSKNNTKNGKIIYEALLKNFNHTKDLPTLLEKLYSPFTSVFYTAKNEENSNKILEDVLRNTPRVVNSKELNNLLPRILGSLKLNKEALKILIKYNVNVKAIDSNNKDALDYYFEYLCVHYRFLNKPVAKNNKSTKIQYMSNAQVEMCKTKIKFLKSLGLSSQRSNYDIHPSVWKILY